MITLMKMMPIALMMIMIVMKKMRGHSCLRRICIAPAAAAAAAAALAAVVVRVVLVIAVVAVAVAGTTGSQLLATTGVQFAF